MPGDASVSGVQDHSLVSDCPPHVGTDEMHILEACVVAWRRKVGGRAGESDGGRQEHGHAYHAGRCVERDTFHHPWSPVLGGIGWVQIVIFAT